MDRHRDTHSNNGCLTGLWVGVVRVLVPRGERSRVPCIYFLYHLSFMLCLSIKSQLKFIFLKNPKPHALVKTKTSNEIS